MLDTIRTLVEAYGPSGYEDQTRSLILDQIKGLTADKPTVDAMGSVIAWQRSPKADAPTIMLSSHMDEIGLMVTHVDKQGFLRFTPIGGLFANTLHGNRVRFADGTIGVIGVDAGVKPGDAPAIEQLFVDVSGDGAKIGVGDAAGLYREMVVRGKRLVAKSMDDRMSCAIQVEVMRQLKGKGPAIKIKDSGMLAAPEVIELLEKATKKAKVPYQREVLVAGTTDAASMQLVQAGVRAGCLSIPCRYIHTTSETVDYDDVQNAVRLMAALLQMKI